MEASKRLSLDADLRERILEANVAVHKIEAKYYELMHPEVYSKCEQERVASILQMVNNLVAVDGVNEKKALDFGAGTGNLTGKLLQMGYHVTALDISTEMCKILEKKYKRYLGSQKLVVVNSAIEDVRFDRGNFDLIACYSVLHHLPDYVNIVQRFSGFLRKGGVMYLDHEGSPFYWMHEATLAARMVKSAYIHSIPLLNALHFRVAGMTIPSIDYELSDYWHNKEHPLDHKKIECVFENESFDFFKRTDYYVHSRTWVPNPIFPLYRHVCKPDMSLWIAKK
jgi:2-polyprenyl-3-methyl-5-hydroxy-6-metoxy-1,4-benzoquinol methylase